MRYLVGDAGAGTCVFAVAGDQAINLSAADPAFGTDLMGPIGLGREAVERAHKIAGSAPYLPLAAVRPQLPVARPDKVLCLGLNYVDHVKEGGYDIPDYPAMFIRLPSSLMPAGAPMVRPACSDKLDYEVELMVIIATGGRHIAKADALDHVFGYTVFNDGSVRDYQRKTHQWTPGKNFDATGAIGPIVVTPDEVPAGASGLRIQSRINGEVLQDASTGDMMWSVADTISIISEFCTLAPGDLIATGTPPGVGHARRPPKWMVPGDVVEAEIEGIGICANPIVAEQDLGAAA